MRGSQPARRAAWRWPIGNGRPSAGEDGFGAPVSFPELLAGLERRPIQLRCQIRAPYGRRALQNCWAIAARSTLNQGAEEETAGNLPENLFHARSKNFRPVLFCKNAGNFPHKLLLLE